MLLSKGPDISLSQNLFFGNQAKPTGDGTAKFGFKPA